MVHQVTGAARGLLLLVAAWAFASQAAAEVRALLISCDGLRPDAITAEYAPQLWRLRQAGLTAREALNDNPSVTLPNHTGMLTGLTAKRHRVLTNGDIPGEVPYVTLLDLAHDAGLSSALYASKTKLRFLAHADKQRVIEIDKDPQALTDKVAAAIRSADPPEVIFVHLSQTDVAGHDKGWLSPRYIAAVREVDDCVGRMVAALDERTAASPGSAGPGPYVLVTADHGGSDKNHYLDLDINRRIPWILRGPGVAPGVIHEGLITQVDTCPTLLWLLDIPVPDGLCGAVIASVRGGSYPQRTLPVPMIGSSPPPLSHQYKQFRYLLIACAIGGLCGLGATAARRRAPPPAAAAG